MLYQLNALIIGWNTTVKIPFTFWDILCYSTNPQRTFELLACKNSSDSSRWTMAAVGNRCIRALATLLLPGPPCRHKPVMICPTRSSRFSNGRRDIRFTSIRTLSSMMSGLRSDESSVRSSDSRYGWTLARLSEDLSDSSMAQNPWDRIRQSYNEGEQCVRLRLCYVIVDNVRGCISIHAKEHE